MANLDPRIEAVRAEYGLETSDFWQIPQNKQWVCKHAALEVVATKASIEWQLPTLIQADTAAGIAVLVVAGKMGSRVEWATGEASPKNNKNAYPWAMAEKRAKDRVVLKLAGIHGLVYSEDEMPDDVQRNIPPAANEQSKQSSKPVDEQKQISAAEQKRQCEDIDNELLDCATIADVDKCAKVWAAIMKRDGWSKTYVDFARPKFEERREAIRARRDVVDDIMDQYPGSRVTNVSVDKDFPGDTDIRNVAGRRLHSMEGI